MFICSGDITEMSTWPEFERVVNRFASIQADLKLVIAGNHDWSLDGAHKKSRRDQYVMKNQGRRGLKDAVKEAVMDLFKKNNIRYLEEGQHHFELANGARLSVYASPWTPNFKSSAPGFRFPRDEGHKL